MKSPTLSTQEILRWMWRELTSMSNALILLLLMAIAAIPGSLFPQRSSAAEEVNRYLENNPKIGPILDQLQLFEVFSSIWFSAIYLLLFLSLIGCVIPRIFAHWKQWRSSAPRTPTNLQRLPTYRQIPLSGISAEEMLQRMNEVLRKNNYRTEFREHSIAGEKGLIKEAGNLVFHLSLLGILISVALSGLYGYTGQKALIEGETFVNNLSNYDNFTPGSYFSAQHLEPYSITLKKFNVQYDMESKKLLGQPLDFTATVTTNVGEDGSKKQETLKVNEPLSLKNTNVYLVGNGYAPKITVRDGKGKVAFSQAVISLPNDSMNTSTLTVKVPDAQPSQLAFMGFLLPTTEKSAEGISFSSFPDLLNPTLTLDSYTGDLGLNNGQPQNVYLLNTKTLTQINGRKLPVGGIVLKPGETYQLPEGKGSITLDGIVRYVGLDIHHDPGEIGALVFAATGLGSLTLSLFIPRRRAWAKIKDHTVEFALLARGEDFTLEKEADYFVKHVRKKSEN